MDGQLNSSKQSVKNLVFDLFGFRSWWDEKLILNVYVVLCLGDELKIPDMNAELCLLYRTSNGPVSYRTQKLALMLTFILNSLKRVVLPYLSRTLFFWVDIFINLSDDLFWFYFKLFQVNHIVFVNLCLILSRGMALYQRRSFFFIYSLDRRRTILFVLKFWFPFIVLLILHIKKLLVNLCHIMLEIVWSCVYFFLSVQLL